MIEGSETRRIPLQPRLAKLKPEQKREKYSKYASHELNYFLFEKDPEFFRTAIKPFLANKKDKTFLDRWLLEKNLSVYLDPWQFDGATLWSARYSRSGLPVKARKPRGSSTI